MMDRFSKALATALKEGKLSSKYAEIVRHFFEGYVATLGDRFSEREEALFMTYLDLICKQYQTPYPFQPYHKALRKPFDYYQFGIDVLSPLVDKKVSSVKGALLFKEIKEALLLGENVIFLANHQTEADPVAISILLEKMAPEIAENLIFVAGERVTTDPLAVPFSLGIHLLCIYSKRYIDHPKEEKRAKQLHNQHTMETMSALLQEGGKAIYVAPSGGRDRPGEDGTFQVAPFDPQSIEMLYLMTKKARLPTHFYPLTLKTHSLLPPPERVQIELGEMRKAQDAVIHLALSPKVDMELEGQGSGSDKRLRRKQRADAIYAIVCKAYSQLP